MHLTVEWVGGKRREVGFGVRVKVSIVWDSDHFA